MPLIREYTNQAMHELIMAAGTQTDLAAMIADRTGEETYQSRVSHYLNHEGSIPLDKVQVLLDIARSLGLKKLKATDFRPDLAGLVK